MGIGLLAGALLRKEGRLEPAPTEVQKTGFRVMTIFVSVRSLGPKHTGRRMTIVPSVTLGSDRRRPPKSVR
jgi:hypothetical protein